MADVCLNRLLCDDKLSSDFRVRQALRNQAKDFCFAFGQRRKRGS